MYQNNILILIASPILSLSLSGAVMPERTAGDISSSEDESSYEEVVVEEPKPVEPEPELPGDTTSSEETTSDESTKKRTREVEGPRGELRGRPKNRSPETRREGRALPEGRDKRPRSPEPPAGRDKRPRSPSPPAGRDKRPRSPEPPEGGKAKGKSKGKKGAQQYVPCPICRTQVKNNVCSKDQHQYWSVCCNTWRRYNAGMTWNLAQAAAERQKRRRERRERREQQGEEIPAKHRKGKEVARKEKAEKKKGDKGKKDTGQEGKKKEDEATQPKPRACQACWEERRKTSKLVCKRGGTPRRPWFSKAMDQGVSLGPAVRTPRNHHDLRVLALCGWRLRVGSSKHGLCAMRWDLRAQDVLLRHHLN